MNGTRCFSVVVVVREKGGVGKLISHSLCQCQWLIGNTRHSIFTVFFIPFFVSVFSHCKLISWGAASVALRTPFKSQSLSNKIEINFAQRRHKKHKRCCCSSASRCCCCCCCKSFFSLWHKLNLKQNSSKKWVRNRSLLRDTLEKVLSLDEKEYEMFSILSET